MQTHLLIDSPKHESHMEEKIFIMFSFYALMVWWTSLNLLQNAGGHLFVIENAARIFSSLFLDIKLLNLKGVASNAPIVFVDQNPLW